MSEDDPFSEFSQDRTIIKPSAGRSNRASVQVPIAAAQPESIALPEIPIAVGLSPLLQLASSLLVTGSRIRTMPQHANPAALRAALVTAVQQFEMSARVRGLPNEQVLAGRYILCTYVDECASNTPWGGSGVWSTHSLLVHFHSESWGGEKVFQLLGKLAENVGANRGLLELIYAVLSLGFEGRYRVLQNGQAQLDGVREKLALMLREQSGTSNPELSPHWAGISTAGRGLSDGLPVWVAASVAVLVLAGIFMILQILLSGQSDDVFASIQSMDVKAAALPVAVPAVPAAKPRLSGFLKPEIDAGLVEVRDLADRSIITIRGDGFFNPGSAEVESKVLPLLNRIADELAGIPGQILVTGHTDNQPIRSARYPSNWHLSQDRAQSVREIMSEKIKPERIRSEGLADTQSVGDNSTASGRAKNRRVEITLTLAQAA